MDNGQDPFSDTILKTPGTVKLTTDGVTKYSSDYFGLSYLDMMSLCTCFECEKMYKKDMMFGKKSSESMCFHCVVNNLRNTIDSDTLWLYRDMCYKDHKKEACDRENCHLCQTDIGAEQNCEDGDLIVRASV